MIYLVRHGESVFNKENRAQGHSMNPLSEEGVMQVQNISEDILKLPITKIYCSDLKRAVQTAEILNKELNLPIVLDSRLREFDCGESIRGLLKQDRPVDLYDNPKKYGAETAPDVYIRMSDFLDELKANKVDNVLIVGHGGSLGMMMYILENPALTKEDIIKTMSNFTRASVPFRYNLRNAEIVELDIYR